MPPKLRDDPYGGYNFEIEINGVSDDGGAVKGSFAEVSGLEVEIQPIEYRNGAEDITPRMIAGMKKYPRLVLKRGIIGDAALVKWIEEAMDGKVRRTECSVILLDENRQEVMRWNFDRGWPTKYTGPSLAAGKNEIAMETLVLSVESLTIA
jgi:phage tail-like protein